MNGHVIRGSKWASFVLFLMMPMLVIGSALTVRGNGPPTHSYMPVVSGKSMCASLGETYGSLIIEGQPSDRPAASHPDLNLFLRGYVQTNAYLGLVNYNGSEDPNAPRLKGLFADQRTPPFVHAYRVYDWNWDCNCKGNPIAWPEVTLIAMKTRNKEVIYVPKAGYTIGLGYQVLVLYASGNRITLKYTREDNVVQGYTIHLEGICVDPDLLRLYRSLNTAGRTRLPALRGGQPFARVRSNEVKVAIRDAGTFIDPRSAKDWW